MNKPRLALAATAGLMLMVGSASSAFGGVTDSAGGSAADVTAAAVSDTDAGAARASAAETLAYWTPEALRSAQPVQPTVDRAPASVAARTAAAGEAGSIAPAPNSAAQGKAAAASLPEPTTFPGGGAAYDYPPPFTSGMDVVDMGIDPTVFPYAPNAKIFFSDPRTGGNFVCSGAVINAPNGSVVQTAGHCVANGGRGYFYANWLVCPAYDAFAIGDPCQLGRFTAKQAWTLSVWLNNGWLEFDHGAIVTNCDDGRPADPAGNCSGAFGSTIQSITGGEGLAWNQPVVQHFWNFGYPQGAPFNGTRMKLSTSSSNRLDSPSGHTPFTIGIGSNFTGGSSGGQWYIGFGPGGGYANGHNDYIYTNQPSQMYSPYYGNDMLAVYNAAAAS